MAKIHIHRAHDLGLERARVVARSWARTAEQQFDMTSTVTEGEASDVVAFTRAGVDGQLVVDAEAFDLTVRLGLLLSAFSARVEAELEANVDKLLAEEKRAMPARRAGARRAG